jgi:hypothetical protein
MSRRPKRRDYLDAAIVASWRRPEEAEPDISTRAANGDNPRRYRRDVDLQIEALQPAGALRREH